MTGDVLVGSYTSRGGVSLESMPIHAPERVPHLRAPVVIWADHDVNVDGVIRLANRLHVRIPEIVGDEITTATLRARSEKAGRTVLGIHGSGVIDGTFVRSAADARKVLARHQNTDPDRLGSSIRGVLTLYLWSPNPAQVDIVPDPWGGFVFHFRDIHVHAFSTDLRALVETLRSMGYRPRRSLDFATEVAATGSGGLSPSSYEDVDVLDSFERVKVTSEGIQISRYSVADKVLTPFESYAEGLEQVRTEIEDNIRAVSAASEAGGPEIIAHLTGGLDTRMILAASKSLGLASKFTFLSMGPETMADRWVAGRLAAEFGLTMTEWRATQVLRNPSTIAEQALWPMEFSSGLLTAGPHEHMAGADTVVLSGGFGGNFKGNYSKSLDDASAPVTFEETARIAERIWGGRAYSTDSDIGLYSSETVNRRISRFHEIRLAAEQMGMDSGAGLDWAFINVRNRYFVVPTTLEWNTYVHRFDPLYCLSGARLALSLSVKERAANWVVFDLLRGWDERLLSLPFDTPRMNSTYQELRGPVPSLDFTDLQRQPSFDGRKSDKPLNGRVDLLPTTPQVIELANAMNAPLWQIRDLDAVRTALRDVIDRTDSALVDAIFNRRRLNTLLRADLKNRVAVRQVHHLHATLLWFANN